MRRLDSFAVVLSLFALIPEVAAADGPARLLKDISPDPYSPSYVATAVGPDGKERALYFANDGSSNDTTSIALWATDGTPKGTTRIRTLFTWLFNPIGTTLGGIAYFGASDGVNGQELWRSDGTSEGTWMVHDPLPEVPVWNGLQSAPVACDGRVYYGGDDGYLANELWSSDGTDGGTGLVRDITPGDEGTFFEHLMVAGNTLFFTARRNLWTSDGTEAGTHVVKEISLGSRGFCCNNMTPWNGRLFFYASDGLHRGGPWVSDGTEQGTVQIKEMSPPGTGWFDEVKVIGDTVYFSTNDGIHGFELWKTDGTEPGTVVTRDIHPGIGSSFLSFLGTVGESLLFMVRNDPEPGWDIWKSDGTEAGTVRLTGSFAGDAFAAIDLPGGVLFSLTGTAEEGRELWRTDGTAEGTVLAQDLAPGPWSSDPRHFVRVGTHVVFDADDPAANRELFAGHTALLMGRPDLAVQDLAIEVQALGLPKGVETSLLARLNPAASGIASGRNVAAVAALENFIRHVEMQVPRRISAEDAADLTQFARDLADMLSANSAPGAQRPSKPRGPQPVLEND